MKFTWIILINYFAEIKGCGADVLPKVTGKGELDSDKLFYEIGEEVKIICGSGFIADSTDTAICTDNVFVPNVLNCIEKGK